MKVEKDNIEELKKFLKIEAEEERDIVLIEAQRDLLCLILTIEGKTPKEIAKSFCEEGEKDLELSDRQVYRWLINARLLYECWIARIILYENCKSDADFDKTFEHIEEIQKSLGKYYFSKEEELEYWNGTHKLSNLLYLVLNLLKQTGKRVKSVGNPLKFDRDTNII